MVDTTTKPIATLSGGYCPPPATDPSTSWASPGITAASNVVSASTTIVSGGGSNWGTGGYGPGGIGDVPGGIPKGRVGESPPTTYGNQVYYGAWAQGPQTSSTTAATAATAATDRAVLIQTTRPFEGMEAGTTYRAYKTSQGDYYYFNEGGERRGIPAGRFQEGTEEQVFREYRPEMETPMKDTPLPDNVLPQTPFSMDVMGQLKGKAYRGEDIIAHPGITRGEGLSPYEHKFPQLAMETGAIKGAEAWEKTPYWEKVFKIGATTFIASTIPGAGLAALPFNLARPVITGMALTSTFEVGKAASEGPGFAAVLTSPEFVGTMAGGYAGFRVGALSASPWAAGGRPVSVKQTSLMAVYDTPLQTEAGMQYTGMGLTEQRFMSGSPPRRTAIFGITKSLSTDLTKPEFKLIEAPAGALKKDMLVFQEPGRAVVNAPSSLKGDFMKTMAKVEQKSSTEMGATLRIEEHKDFFGMKGFEEYKVQALKPTKTPGQTDVLEPIVKFDQYEITPFAKETAAVKKAPEMKEFGLMETRWLDERTALTKARARHRVGKQDYIVDTEQMTRFVKTPTFKETGGLARPPTLRESGALGIREGYAGGKMGKGDRAPALGRAQKQAFGSGPSRQIPMIQPVALPAGEVRTAGAAMFAAPPRQAQLARPQMFQEQKDMFKTGIGMDIVLPDVDVSKITQNALGTGNLLKQRQAQESLLKQIQEPLQSQALTPALRQSRAMAMAQATAQRTMVRTTTPAVPRMRVSPRGFRPVRPFLFFNERPDRGIVPAPWRGGGEKRGSRYSQTAVANVFQIREAVNTGKTWTGLEYYRPIASGKKPKKSRSIGGIEVPLQGFDSSKIRLENQNILPSGRKGRKRGLFDFKDSDII